MSITVIEQGAACRLIFDGSLTYLHAGDLESQIEALLQRCERLEVDLSRVQEIDLYGIHLLGLLQNRADRSVDIIANSAVVEQAPARLLVSPKASWLRGYRSPLAVGV